VREGRTSRRTINNSSQACMQLIFWRCGLIDNITWMHPWCQFWWAVTDQMARKWRNNLESARNTDKKKNFTGKETCNHTVTDYTNTHYLV